MVKRLIEKQLPDDAIVCNCAGCGALLTGPAYFEKLSQACKDLYPRPVEDRINGRPYCAPCMTPQSLGCGNTPPRFVEGNEAGASQQDAIRHMEEGMPDDVS